jgi:hypothetical protein
MTVDIPAIMHRQLKAQAAALKCSPRQLILSGIRRLCFGVEKPPGKPVRFPLIISEGPRVNLTSEQIYGDVG